MIDKIKRLSSTVVVLAIFAFSFIADVRAVEVFPLCFLKAISGFDCPGCGLTRSIISISHGEWRAALSYNLLGPIVYILLLFYLIKNLLELLHKEVSFSSFLRRDGYCSRFLFFLFISQWIFKFVNQVRHRLF